MKKKLPKPQKLPSGTWHCQVMVDGRRVSVVAETSGEAQAKAVALRAGLIEQTKRVSSLTVGEAIDRYIESKDAVLSPSTIAGYKRIRANALQDIMPVKLSELTQERIQRSVNAMAKDKSSKSVRNAHGLLSAALSVYRPDMMLRTTMPQKKRSAIGVPSDEEIEKIISVVVGTEMELPVLLAMWLGLRVSEIIGLTWESVEGNVLHVKAAIVDGEKGPVEKGTKTYSGDRRIRLSQYLMDLIDSQPRTSDHIVRLSRRAIGGRFDTICKTAGIPHYRFHDLRHPNVKPKTKNHYSPFCQLTASTHSLFLLVTSSCNRSPITYTSKASEYPFGIPMPLLGTPQAPSRTQSARSNTPCGVALCSV